MRLINADLALLAVTDNKILIYVFYVYGIF